MLARASWIGGHVNWLRPGRNTFELDRAFHAGRTVCRRVWGRPAGIDWVGCGDPEGESKSKQRKQLPGMHDSFTSIRKSGFVSSMGINARFTYCECAGPTKSAGSPALYPRS